MQRSGKTAGDDFADNRVPGQGQKRARKSLTDGTELDNQGALIRTHRDGLPRFSAAARALWRCGASRSVRDAARKPVDGPADTKTFGGPADLQAAPRVAYAARRRASERLDDAPHRRRRSTCPKDRLRDLYGSLLVLLGIK